MVSERNQPFHPIRAQTMFESVSEHFANLQHVKRGKTRVSDQNAVFRGTELAKMVSERNQPFHPIRAQTMFESVSEHFVNLQHVKRGKTCVSGLNALFRGTEVVKMVSERNQPFHTIRPQTMFESVSEHFANLQHVKRGKTCVSEQNAVFWGTEVAKIVSEWNQPFHPIRPQMMFESVSEHFANLWDVKRGKICVRASLPYFGVPNCENGIATK